MLKDGRIAWPVFFAALFSTWVIIAADYAWRMVQAPIATIATASLAVLIAGNAAIFIAGRRLR